MSLVGSNKNRESPNAPDPGAAGFTARAPRFSIMAPLLYRASGGRAWSEGTTINISRSGVLFWAEQDIDTNTEIEMRIEFPGKITGGTPANVVCHGPVVRKESTQPPESRAALAASIVKYRFVHE